MAAQMINRKKRCNDKRKIAEYNKRARLGMKGFILKWDDSDPFAENGDITDTGISHANPTQRLVAGEMWRTCSQWITKTEFTWDVQMTVVHETEKRGEKLDTFDFHFTCAIRGNKSEILDQAMEAALKEAMDGNAALPDGHKNKGHYIKCKFIAQIVGV